MSHGADNPHNKALLVRMETKPDKGDEFEAFLRNGLEAINEEEGTTAWFAVRFGETSFAVFDTFTGDVARLGHLAGKVGRGLIAHTPTLLAKAPSIEHAHVLAFKVPGASGQS